MNQSDLISITSSSSSSSLIYRGILSNPTLDSENGRRYKEIPIRRTTNIWRESHMNIEVHFKRGGWVTKRQRSTTELLVGLAQ